MIKISKNVTNFFCTENYSDFIKKNKCPNCNSTFHSTEDFRFGFFKYVCFKCHLVYIATFEKDKLEDVLVDKFYNIGGNIDVRNLPGFTSTRE